MTSARGTALAPDPHGPLPYRSLRFKFETHPVERYQPAAVINYPNDHEYTRVTAIDAA